MTRAARALFIFSLALCAYAQGTSDSEERFKSQVEEAKALLAKAKQPTDLEPNLSEDHPYENLYKRIAEMHPDLPKYRARLAQKTRQNLDCPVTAAEFFRALEIKENETQTCEAAGGVQKKEFLAAVASALKTAAREESKEAIEKREKAALKILAKPKESRLLAKFRPGFEDCGLSDAEIIAIGAYTENAYLALNEQARGGGTSSLIETINSGLRKLNPYKGVVRRAVNELGDDLSKLVPGAVVTFRGFTSTTAFGPGYEGRYTFEIQSCSGRYIAPLSTNFKEEEVLFPTQSRFGVSDRIPRGGGAIHFRLIELCGK